MHYQIAFIFLLVGVVFGGSVYEIVPCTDLEGGVHPDDGEFSDPIYFNGQSLGPFTYNFTDIDGNQNSGTFPYDGFPWFWKSRNYGSGNGGNVPCFMLPNEYLFWNLLAPGANGFQWNNNYNGSHYELRTCEVDNESFTDGPGTLNPGNTNWWEAIVPPTYTLKFWQKVYVPSSPTANWARVVHFFTNEGNDTVHINYRSTSYYNPGTLFYNPESTERYGIFSDIDQGRAIGYIPMSINWMSNNARIRTYASNTLDCDSHDINADFNFVPGATVAFMHIISYGWNISQAVENARWVDTNSAELYTKLTDTEIAQIMNWDGCTTVYGSEFKVDAVQSDLCTTSNAVISISTTTDLNGTITHRILNSTGQVVVSDVTTSATFDVAGRYLIETLRYGCVVKRTPFDVVINDASFDSSTGLLKGSNGPYKLTIANGADSVTITATDNNGCPVTGSMNTVTKVSPGQTIASAMLLAVGILSLLLL